MPGAGVFLFGAALVVDTSWTYSTLLVTHLSNFFQQLQEVITMSEIDDRFVYRGFWTNREYGPVMGHTVTTDVTTSNIIVALLAVVSSKSNYHLEHGLT